MSRFLLQAALRPKIVTIARPISLTVPVQNYKMKEHFVRLGIEPDAELDEIKKAYFEASKLCHPDLHPNDKVKEQRYIRLSESYELCIKFKKENNSKLRTQVTHKRGQSFGGGKLFRPEKSTNETKVKSVPVKTPLGFGRGTAKKSFQTGTFRGAKDQYTQDVIDKFKGR